MNEKPPGSHRLTKKGYHFTSRKTDYKPEALQKNQDLVKALQYILDISKGTITEKTAGTHQSAINKFKEYIPKHGFDIRDFTIKEAVLFRDHLNYIHIRRWCFHHGQQIKMLLVGHFKQVHLPVGFSRAEAGMAG